MSTFSMELIKGRTIKYIYIFNGTYKRQNNDKRQNRVRQDYEKMVAVAAQSQNFTFQTFFKKVKKNPGNQN